MYAKIENDQIQEIVSKTPTAVYDPQIKRLVPLHGQNAKQQYGYYFIHKDNITDPTKTYGQPVFDPVENRAYYQIVDRIYPDYYDDSQIPPKLVKSALELMKEQRHSELDQLQATVRNSAVDWIIKKYVTNSNWSQPERKVFQDFFDQITTWRAEVDSATDIKELHRKQFDLNTLQTLQSEILKHINQGRG